MAQQPNVFTRTVARRLTLAFQPGQVAVTPACLDKVSLRYACACLAQHLSGNWGLVSEDDWKANDHALRTDQRLLSSYALPDDPGVFWIITEADRSVTTLLLPEDY